MSGRKNTKGNSIIFAYSLHSTIINAFYSESRKARSLEKPRVKSSHFNPFLILFSFRKRLFSPLSRPWHDLYSAILLGMHTSGICEYLFKKGAGMLQSASKPKHKACRRFTYSQAYYNTINLDALWSHKLCECTKSVLFKICINWTLKFTQPGTQAYTCGECRLMHYTYTYMQQEHKSWYSKHRWG